MKKNYKIITCLLLLTGFRLYAATAFTNHTMTMESQPNFEPTKSGGQPVSGAHVGPTGKPVPTDVQVHESGSHTTLPQGSKPTSSGPLKRTLVTDGSDPLNFFEPTKPETPTAANENGVFLTEGPTEHTAQQNADAAKFDSSTSHDIRFDTAQHSSGFDAFSDTTHATHENTTSPIKPDVQLTDNVTEVKTETSAPEAQAAEHATEIKSEGPITPENATAQLTHTTETSHVISNTFSKTNTSTKVTRDLTTKEITETTTEVTDKKGNLISRKITKPDGSSVETTYNTDGTVKEIGTTGAKIDGKQTTNVTDANGKKIRTIEVTDSGSRFVRKTIKTTSYDATTQLPTEITTADSSGKPSMHEKFTYDNGKTILIRRTDGNDKEISTQIFNPDGVSYRIQKNNRIIELHEVDAATGKEITTKYNDHRDSSDKSSITTITDPAKPGEIITEVRDKNGNVVEAKDKSSESTDSSQAGNKISRTTKTVSNMIHDTFSTKSNKRVTRNNPDGTKTVITSGKVMGPDGAKIDHMLSEITTDKNGNIIKTTTYNPISKTTVTVEFNNPGKDQTSITTIEKPNDPASPITEIRDVDGEIRSIKDKNGKEIGVKDANGKIIPTKTTMTSLEKLSDIHKNPNEVFKEDIDTATYQALKEFSDALAKSDRVTHNKSSVHQKTFDTAQEDVNATTRTIENQELASRGVIQAKFNQLRGRGSVAGAKALVKAGKDLLFTKNSAKEQLDFTKDLIQRSLDARLGKDKGGQSHFVLSEIKLENGEVKGQNEVLAEKILENPEYSKLFDGSELSDLETINLIAKMENEASNYISDGIYKTETTFDADGNCVIKTTSTNKDGTQVTLSSSFDTNGNTTKNSMIIDGIEYTTKPGTGWSYGSKQITKSKVGEEGPAEGTPLESQDGAFLTQGWILNKSVKAFKLATKIALQAPKQIVINGALLPIPVSAQVVAFATYVPTVKIGSMIPARHVKGVNGKPKPVMDEAGNPVFEKDQQGNFKLDKNNQKIPKLEVNSFSGYQFSGHDFFDPTVRASMFKLADLTIGDDGHSVFSEAVGIKEPFVPMGKGSPVFTPDSSMAKWLNSKQGKTPEQAAQESANLNESYFTLIDPVIEAAQLPFKFLFPQSVGDRIVLKKAKDITTESADATTTKNETEQTKAAQETSQPNAKAPKQSRGKGTAEKMLDTNQKANALNGGPSSLGTAINILALLL